MTRRRFENAVKHSSLHVQIVAGDSQLPTADNVIDAVTITDKSSTPYSQSTTVLWEYVPRMRESCGEGVLGLPDQGCQTTVPGGRSRAR